MSQTISIKYKRTVQQEIDLTEALNQQQEWAVRQAYKKQYRSIKKMVYTFNNARLNPRDIFQEGLARAILNIRQGTFRGDCSFATYLNSICRNICLKELNRNNELPANEPLANLPDEPTDNYFELLDSVLKLKEKLNEKCRAIIDLRFRLGMKNQANEKETGNRLIPFEHIARQIGIATENARQRFARCLKQLKELVNNDPIIKEHLDY